MAKVGASKKTLLPSEQDRPDVARCRARWKKYQGRLDPRRLVFIDETWAKTNMAPIRGWARRGYRLPGQAPYGHWKTMTFLAALRHDRIDAPWVLDGLINGAAFLTYVDKILVYHLRRYFAYAAKSRRGVYLPRRSHHDTAPTKGVRMNPNRTEQGKGLLGGLEKERAMEILVPAKGRKTA